MANKPITFATIALSGSTSAQGEVIQTFDDGTVTINTTAGVIRGKPVTPVQK